MSPSPLAMSTARDIPAPWAPSPTLSILTCFNKTLTIPKEAQKGQGLVTASLFSLYGASGSPTLSNYNVTVTFGDKTSTEYKSSQA
ncbi:hypothetical protein NM208_g16979 [Fusarium decemcellulare]|uniref:Uncharacterized protein n=1 Tax=Fusarium decemcellulare TaxID=57161 RepID=A0ACC1RC26_9HYPO|nr:hypothetical protein NM208_g16979 [Fusarium decemcellulare]